MTYKERKEKIDYLVDRYQRAKPIPPRSKVSAFADILHSYNDSQIDDLYLNEKNREERELRL